MVNIGVIGYGYWGPNLVRNFGESANARLAAVSDLNPDRLELVRKRHPTAHTTTDYRELLSDSQIDALVIATPVSSHFTLAMEALRAGKHVLVEKPLAATAEQAGRLIDEAQRRQRILMVDHTFVYTGAVRKMQELVAANALGTVYYYDSVRVNLGLFQHDVNVLWDLAVHDLSIMDYILAEQPCAVSATGMRHVAERPENIAYLTLFFASNLIGHIHVNWLAPVKVRRTLIGGSQKMIVYDDLEPSEKVKVYDKGITLNNNGARHNGAGHNSAGEQSNGHKYQMLVGYRTGDMWAPQLSLSEALWTEANHFVECIEGGKTPITDGEAGLRIVQILEAATQSMGAQGRPVTIAGRRIAV